MAFNSSGLIGSAVQRIRLTVGDISEDFPILDDSVYEYLLYKNGSDELKTAIEALENIINYYSLNPESEAFGQVSGSGFNPTQMESRLKELRSRKVEDAQGVKRVPIIVKSDRKDWCDFNKIFGD